ELAHAQQKIAASLPELTSRLDRLFSNLELDVLRAFGADWLTLVRLDELAGRLVEWRDNLEALSQFITLTVLCRKLIEQGCGTLIDALHDGSLAHDQLLLAYDRSYAEVLRVTLFNEWPELKAFDGEAHNRAVATFRQLDR